MHGAVVWLSAGSVEATGSVTPLMQQVTTGPIYTVVATGPPNAVKN